MRNQEVQTDHLESPSAHLKRLSSMDVILKVAHPMSALLTTVAGPASEIPEHPSSCSSSSSTDEERKMEPQENRTSEKENAANKKKLLCCLGLFYALLSGVFFSLCAGTVKYLKDLDPGQVAFYQYIAITVFSLPKVIFSRRHPLGPTTKRSRYFLFLCGIFDAITIYLSFVSFRYLPLADATVLTSSVPVFVTITARVLLKESCGVAQVIAVVMTVAGVALVSKVPLLLTNANHVYTKESLIGILAAIGSIASESGVYILLRKLNEVDAFVILFNFGWVATIVTAALTAIFGEFSLAHCGFQRWLVIAVGGFSFLSQLLLTKALEFEEAGPVSILMAAGDIILAFILQMTLFYEAPDVYVIAGTVLVSFSVIIVGIKKWLDGMPAGAFIKQKMFSLVEKKISV